MGQKIEVTRDTFFSLFWERINDHTRGYLCALAGLDESWCLFTWDELPDEGRATLGGEIMQVLAAHEGHRVAEAERRAARCAPVKGAAA